MRIFFFLMAAGLLFSVAQNGMFRGINDDAQVEFRHPASAFNNEPSYTYPSNFPNDAIKPDFCTIDNITNVKDGGQYALWGYTTMPLNSAGGRVHAHMRNTSWIPDGVIKQSDAAVLFYNNGEIKLSYAFHQQDSGRNRCVISWEPVDYQANLR